MLKTAQNNAKSAKSAAILSVCGICFTINAALFAISSTFLVVNSAYASATSDAQQVLNKAYNDYYTALSTGPAKTPQEQAKLRDEIIGPAQVAMNKAIQKDATSFDPNAAAKNGSAGANSNFRSNSRASLGNPAADTGSGNAAAAPDTSANSAPIEASAPREIEFPGPLALPKASPSPAKAPVKTH